MNWGKEEKKSELNNSNTHFITPFRNYTINEKDDFDKFKGYQLPELTKLELKTSGSLKFTIFVHLLHSQ